MDTQEHPPNTMPELIIYLTMYFRVSIASIASFEENPRFALNSFSFPSLYSELKHASKLLALPANSVCRIFFRFTVMFLGSILLHLVNNSFKEGHNSANDRLRKSEAKTESSSHCCMSPSDIEYILPANFVKGCLYSAWG